MDKERMQTLSDIAEEIDVLKWEVASVKESGDHTDVELYKLESIIKRLDAVYDDLNSFNK